VTVWLIVFLLANGEQAEPSSGWLPSQHECEQKRLQLETEIAAQGWSTSCIAWEAPENFEPVKSNKPSNETEIIAACDNTLVLRRLQDLQYKLDGLDASVAKVGSTTETSIRDLDRSIKRVEGSVQSIRCYR
jgi:hypothetical protein